MSEQRPGTSYAALTQHTVHARQQFCDTGTVPACVHAQQRALSCIPGPASAAGLRVQTADSQHTRIPTKKSYWLPTEKGRYALYLERSQQPLARQGACKEGPLNNSGGPRGGRGPSRRQRAPLTERTGARAAAINTEMQG